MRLSSPGGNQVSTDALYPLSLDASPPAAGTAEYLQDDAIRLVVEFFREKGRAALAREDRTEEWYPDWIDYQAKHGLYAMLLSPQQYSTRGSRFDLVRLTRFAETLAYFSPAHAYSLHVSLLGLFPILMSSNEALKREAVAKLEGGGLFAFAVSERRHGSDLLANEFTVTPTDGGGYRADGNKQYIGNANAACLISVLGKKGNNTSRPTKRAPFVLFALRPQESRGYQNVRKIRTLGIRSAFVGEFEVRAHPFPEGDFIAEGREAWETVFNTVIFCKFLLGFGAIGICEHGVAEAVTHMRGRVLYGKPVIEIPHLRAATAIAFARLTAMKLYACRAVEYLLAAGPDDRRYLLFNAVQKARVSTEGVKVMGLLAECVGARGVEADTFFESGWRDVQLIPSLEGSTHINFGLTAQFLDPYFATTDGEVSVPHSVLPNRSAAAENPYWMGSPDRTPKTVRFAPYLAAYQPRPPVANVRLFVRQAKDLRVFAAAGLSALNPESDAGRQIALGRCFSVIAYAQLVAENCRAAETPIAMIAVMFHALVEDLSAEALKLSVLFPRGSVERASLKRMIRVPDTSDADLESVAEVFMERYRS